MQLNWLNILHLIQPVYTDYSQSVQFLTNRRKPTEVESPQKVLHIILKMGNTPICLNN